MLAATAGDLSPETAGLAVADLEAELLASRDAEGQLVAIQQRLDALLVEQATISGQRTSAATEVATLQQAVAAHEVTAQAAEDEVAAALADDDATTVSAAVARVAATTEQLEAALAAVRALDAAERRLGETTERAAQTAARHGFATHRRGHGCASRGAGSRTARQSAAGAGRGGDACAGGARRDRRRDDATEDPADELEARQRALVEAEARATGCARSLAVHEERSGALRSQVAGLGEALETWAPLRDEALRAESMSRLVRGMGHDNQLQMRLSAYVLATRLDQVVDAANERLGQMRDQRYLLQRTGRAQRRTGQAGLGLEVVDQWTGDVRAPTTLSGGETFVVSLALALGLADVVTHEAAGAEVETLFVDEGFGTLDADTLDDVMDRLDGLRAGGRTVGVVSHVTELRTRIPTQVHVEKGRAGSSVTVHTLVG